MIRAGVTPVRIGGRDGPMSVQGQGLFNPLSISGMVGWWDMSDQATLYQDFTFTTRVTADGQVIQGVRDKSGNGVHLTEGANPPTYKVGIQNGLSVARFDGVNDTLFNNTTAGALASFTVFIVHKVTSKSGTYDGVMTWGSPPAGGGGAGFKWITVGAGAAVNPCIVDYTGSAEQAIRSATATDFAGTWWIGIGDNTSTTTRIFGTAGTQLDNATPGGGFADQGVVQLGNYNSGDSTAFMTGDFGEVMVFNRVLPDSERDSLRGNFRAKWAL